MKYRPSPRAATLILVALVALAATDARARGATNAQTCPQIRVECPDTVKPDEDVSFKVSVSDADPSVTLTFKWDVAGGQISGGQDTDSITIDRKGFAGQALTATVEVGGLPDGCEGSNSCTITDFDQSGPIHRLIDTYGKVNFEQEEAHLDNFVTALRDEPGTQGYVIVYAGRRASAGEAAKRGARARSYLVNKREIDPERLVVVDGGHREELTFELYVVPTGAQPPEPSPSVEPSEVEIIAAPKPKRGRNPRPR